MVVFGGAFVAMSAEAVCDYFHYAVLNVTKKETMLVDTVPAVAGKGLGKVFRNHPNCLTLLLALPSLLEPTPSSPVICVMFVVDATVSFAAASQYQPCSKA